MGSFANWNQRTILGRPVLFVVDAVRFGVRPEQIVGATVRPGTTVQVLGRVPASIVTARANLFRFVEGDPPFDVIPERFKQQGGVVHERRHDGALWSDRSDVDTREVSDLVIYLV